MNRKQTFRLALAGLVTGLTIACSQAIETDKPGDQAAPALPEQVVGLASWDGHLKRPIHRVRCEFKPPFYTLQAEGHGFELRVGFWGEKADSTEEVDFEQADSVELTLVTPEEEIYRYTTLRILPEMGEVSGSESSASGKTRLRSTSLAALEEYREGIELDFEFACPLRPGATASGS